MDYLEVIRPMMGKKRFRHCREVEKRAVVLAKKHGADVEKASIAGLLHDICKEMDASTQLEIIKKHGIVLDEDLLGSSKVLHEVAGACYIWEELGLHDEEIFGAVRYHTTGRPDMTLLEKVVYMADLTSADRGFQGVQEIRARSEKNLDDALYRALKFTLCNLVRKDSPVCLETLRAYNFYRRIPREDGKS